MKRKIITSILFVLGALLLEIHTTFAVLWQISGISLPYPLGQSIVLYYAQGFTPILGAVCLLAAGLAYEKLEGTK
jgi:hypothetical protein